jgi:hypothetical protein
MVEIWSAPAAGSPREHLAWDAVDGAFSILSIEDSSNYWW